MVVIHAESLQMVISTCSVQKAELQSKPYFTHTPDHFSFFCDKLKDWICPSLWVIILAFHHVTVATVTLMQDDTKISVRSSMAEITCLENLFGYENYNWAHCSTPPPPPGAPRQGLYIPAKWRVMKTFVIFNLQRQILLICCLINNVVTKSQNTTALSL